MKTLTVFTPTYNRVHTLVRTYESLCRQTCGDFEWLVIDDGSTDNTEEVVAHWITEGKIIIRYIKKDNGGLHTGYITAYANIYTELNVCIDSDDYMPDNAVEIIVRTWTEKGRGRNDIAGIRGLDFIMNEGPIGGFFPEFMECKYWELDDIHDGDTKLVLRTDVIRSLPVMPSYDGEKNFNPSYYYWQIYEKFIMLNENLCWVDYQPTGMAANIYEQYVNSPNSFAQTRRIRLANKEIGLKRKFREAIHYVSSCIFARQWNMIMTSPKPMLTILALPFGIYLNVLIRHKSR